MLTTILLSIDGVPCVWWTHVKGLGPDTKRWHAVGDHGPYSPIHFGEL